MALSTVEDEYIAINLVAQEEVWIHKILVGFFGHILEHIMIHCDN